MLPAPRRRSPGEPPPARMPHDNARLKTAANIPDPDGFYAAWLAAHEGLGDAESIDLDTRLLLLLANQIGDQSVLLACIEEARMGAGAPRIAD